MCRKPVAAALAGGKSGISADAGVVVVDAGEEVDGDEELPREG